MDLFASIHIAHRRALLVLASVLAVAACDESMTSDDGLDTGGDEDVDVHVGTGADVDVTIDPDPDTSVVEPDTSAVELDTTVVEPDTTVVEPDTTVVEPDTTVVEPLDTTVSAPDVDVAPDVDASVPDADVDPSPADVDATTDADTHEVEPDVSLDTTAATTAPGDVNVGPECDCDDSVDPLAALSDDFEDASSLADWQLRAQVEGEPPHHNLLDVDTTVPGALVLDANNYIAPNLPGGATGAGWFEDNKGPLVFKNVTGDFLVVAHVQLGTTADITAQPSGNYNSGGLLARDPASALQPLGDERWLMYNIGYQSSFFGSETKTTMPAAPGGTYSRSALFLTPTPSNIGRLAMCRIGTHFYFFRNMDSAPGWVQEVHTPSNVVVNNLGLPGGNLESGFERPDLPATLQVGIMANRWTEGPVPPRIVVYDIAFSTPHALADCTPE